MEAQQQKGARGAVSVEPCTAALEVHRPRRDTKCERLARWLGWEVSQGNSTGPTEPEGMRVKLSSLELILNQNSVRKGSICRTGRGGGLVRLFVAAGRPSVSRPFRTPISDRRNRYFHVTSYFSPTLPGESHLHSDIAAEDAFCTPDVFTLAFGVSHAGPNALIDDASFHFGESGRDGKHALAHRRGSVHALLIAHKGDIEALKLFERGDEVFCRSSEAVKSPNDNSAKLPALGGRHQFVQLRAGFLRSRLALLNKFNSLPTTRLAVVAEVMKLHFAILINGGNAAIDGCFHGLPSNYYSNCLQASKSSIIILVRTNEEKAVQEKGRIDSKPISSHGRQSACNRTEPGKAARDRTIGRQEEVGKEGIFHRRSPARNIDLPAAAGRLVA